MANRQVSMSRVEIDKISKIIEEDAKEVAIPEKSKLQIGATLTAEGTSGRR